MGIEWTPKIQQQLNSVLGSLPAQMLGPWLNQLTGYAFGGGAAIADAIQRGGQVHGMTPAQTAPIAAAVAKALDDDPALRSNLEVNEIAQIALKGMQTRHLTATDPETFKAQLKLLTEPLAATKNKFSKLGQPVDIGLLWDHIEQAGGFTNPAKYMEQMRMGQYASEAGGPAGLFGVAATQGGEPLRMSPQNIAAGRSNIWNRIQRHPMSNMAAATARISNEFGLKPGSRGEEMADEMMRGQMPTTYGEWSKAMRGSIATAGITPEEIYHQSRFNKAKYLQGNPMLQNALMASSRQRWQPRIASIHAAYPGESVFMQQRRNNALNLMAEQSGFKTNPSMSAWEQMDYLTSYGPESVGLMDEYQQRAQQERLWGNVRQTPINERVVNVLQNIKQPLGPETGWQVGKEMTGFIPKARIQAQAPGATTQQVPGLPKIEDYGQPPKVPKMSALPERA
jgi:hypothetical protein